MGPSGLVKASVTQPGPRASAESASACSVPALGSCLAPAQGLAQTGAPGHAPVPSSSGCSPWGLPAPLWMPWMGESSLLSPPRPQPYRTLKESDSAEGDEADSPKQPSGEPRPPVPAPPDRAASIDLLEDIFSSLDVEAPVQPLGQAKSMEDLRAPKDLPEQPGTFDYQVWRGPGRHLLPHLPHRRQSPQVTVRETEEGIPQPMLRGQLTTDPADWASP